jgi:Protein of unknown function (DUF1579)
MLQQTTNIKLRSQGQSIAPSPEIQRLHLFVGTWNTEGETHASADAPAVKVTGIDTYEWLAGKFFLVHRADRQIGNDRLNTLEFIGYDPSSQTYTASIVAATPIYSKPISEIPFGRLRENHRDSRACLRLVVTL